MNATSQVDNYAGYYLNLDLANKTGSRDYRAWITRVKDILEVDEVKLEQVLEKLSLNLIFFAYHLHSLLESKIAR